MRAMDGRLSWMALLARPGIGLKRWAALGAIGLALFALGAAVVLGGGVSGPLWLGAAFGLLGLAACAAAAWRLHERLSFGARSARGGESAIRSLAGSRIRSRGPRLVAIGGGTGLSVLLRGLKRHTDNLSAIITPADDGGSTGRLREMFGAPPLGDARQCLIALSDAEPLMERVFSHRFDTGEGLEGHSLGNLLLSAMATTEGGFGEALDAAHELLSVRGRVIPSSRLAGVALEAETVSGRLLEGESAEGRAGEPIAALRLTPDGVEANPAALDAVRTADAILIGPGSLYTSILPNLLIAGIADAVRRARCPKVFICNVATQHLETDGLSAADHLSALQRHAGVVPTHFVMNAIMAEIPERFHQQTIPPEPAPHGVATVTADLLDPSWGTRHDPDKLAAAVLSIVRKG